MRQYSSALDSSDRDDANHQLRGWRCRELLAKRNTSTCHSSQVREQGPVLLAGVPANYDPMPVLRNLDTPQLWILAADDHDAPSAETKRRLLGLQDKGKPITVAVFPHTEHGIYEYETTTDGKRVDTRNPEGYFAMMRDFILHGRLDTRHYGTSTIYHPATAPADAGARH